MIAYELDHEKAAGMTDGTIDLQALAAEAYIYGCPLVVDLDEVDRFSRAGRGPVPAAPLNEFSHADRPAGPDDTLPGADHDTIHSVAQLDLSGGALLLTVPDTAGRYYVLQFVDAWTNNFAYVGRRATGTGEASFLLTPPGWDEEVPLGATQIAVPTEMATIIGRWACTGPDDVETVRALQEDTLLEPYWTATGEPRGLPTHTYVPDNEPELLFYEKLRARMAAFPPAPADLTYQQRFAPLGLLDMTSPYAQPDPELAEALRAGYAAGRRKVEETSAELADQRQNGWNLSYHAFDYNADHFEVGTHKGPQWVYTDRELGRQIRAASTHTELWGSHAYEAATATTSTDADGRPLNGDQPYTLRFEKPPPVDAFWSLTVYDEEGRLTANPSDADPIDRYSLGDATPTLTHEDDGSLTLHLQPQRPTEDKSAPNWLPTPTGGFRTTLRMYTPRAALFEGTYELPSVVRGQP
ncbi:DUF1254 domain-containing protein [Streptomyces sp. NPDC048436]|uniref:DUF1254 domain-containing protein n=1 Tax=Streptomyces sp. NPDC048436 TaxID=3365550 RepID=UPI0037152231